MRIYIVFFTLVLGVCADEYAWVNLLEKDSLALWENGEQEEDQEGAVSRIGDLWSLKEGVLLLDPSKKGRGGDLVTRKKDYFHFELQFEFMVSKGGNSGVKYRLSDQHVGFEFQILDDNQDVPEKKKLACLYDLKAASEEKIVKKAGEEWNSGRIFAVGNSIQHWLNGEMVLEIEIGSDEWKKAFRQSGFKGDLKFARTSGPILLQDFGNRLQFRNMRIRKIMATD